MRRRSLRLRGKLVVSFSVVVAVLTAAFGVASYVTFSESLDEAHVALLSREADACVGAIEGVLRAERSALAARALRVSATYGAADAEIRLAFLRALLAEPDVVGAAIVEAQGRRIVGRGRNTAFDEPPVGGVGMTRDGGVVLVLEDAFPAAGGGHPADLRVVLDVAALGARVAGAQINPHAAMSVHAPGRPLFVIGPAAESEGETSGEAPAPWVARTHAGPRTAGDWLVADRTLSMGGWTLAYALPRDAIGADLATLRERLIAAALVTFWVAIWIVLVVANRISQPLRRLADAAKDMDTFTREAGVLAERAGDEIGDLGRAVHALQLHIQEAVTRDPLTQVFNRRFLMNTLDLEMARARRTGSEIACLMIDIDHFKQVNDAHGHRAGDAVLVGVARTLVETTRAADAVARYGGEEFAIVCGPTTSAGIDVAAERVREAIERAEFVHEGVTIRCTVSIGVALGPCGDEGSEGLIGRADAALYESKRTGRNRVTLAEGGHAGR